MQKNAPSECQVLYYWIIISIALMSINHITAVVGGGANLHFFIYRWVVL